MRFVLTLLPPLAAALAAYLLNRGSSTRRLRTKALDELQIADRARTLLAGHEALVDQMGAQARVSLSEYLSSQAKATQRRLAAKTSILVGLVALGWSSVVVMAADISSDVVLLVGGAGGALLCLGVQEGLERRERRRALGAIPVATQQQTG